ncbi:hypothetical protein Salat_2539100 [Sesamum alatum]|uniref:Uncharacterized protein n=1 Tax=Sesamum alatum TaxID=300844 RepID=A0AAE1XT63_9LAMI|nr:hypothetical protein Salat_2539100 [Sesamum alatum]
MLPLRKGAKQKALAPISYSSQAASTSGMRASKSRFRRLLSYWPCLLDWLSPPRVGTFAFTNESLSSVIQRSFLMDDEKDPSFPTVTSGSNVNMDVASSSAMTLASNVRAHFDSAIVLSPIYSIRYSIPVAFN